MAAAGIGFRRQDNCITHVEDFDAAQKLLDAQPWADWTGMLNALLDRACPALRDLTYREQRLNYYWSADEMEWATDVVFRSPKFLADLYPSLVRHAITTFSSRDVLRFLGRSRSPMTNGIHHKSVKILLPREDFLSAYSVGGPRNTRNTRKW